MKRETDSGVRQPQAKELLELPEAGGGKEGVFPKAFRGSTAFSTP